MNCAMGPWQRQKSFCVRERGREAVMRCPCRKKSEASDYSDCCGPYHTGAQIPPTAEALMRSRYSAFALQNEDYLIASWHPSTRVERVGFTPDQEWLLLRIIATKSDGDQATVEFTASSRINGRSQVQHERSQFVRENERWYYLQGEPQ